MFHFLPFSHFCLHECRGLAQERELRFIRPSGQGSTPHFRGLFQARGMAGCRGSQAQPSDLLKEDIRELFVDSQTDMPDKTDGKLSLDFEFD